MATVHHFTEVRSDLTRTRLVGSQVNAHAVLAWSGGFEDAASKDVRKELLKSAHLQHCLQLVRGPPRAKALRPVEEREGAIGVALENELTGTPCADAVRVGDVFEGTWAEDKVLWRRRSRLDPAVVNGVEAVGTTSAQSLSNKTLVSPTLSGGPVVNGARLGGRVAVPATATTASLPGDWAADAANIYAYTGDGTTHAWVRSAAATW